MKIKKDDTVMVIAGRDVGKKGKVRFAYPREGRLIVEGINFVKRHTRASGQVRQAGIIEREAPIDVSSVLLVCNKCDKSARIGYRFLADGRKVRFCRACGEVID